MNACVWFLLLMMSPLLALVITLILFGLVRVLSDLVFWFFPKR